MRCLFCKQSSHLSKSVEHVIPESIGSKKKVLPAGVVCDKCNNYFSRKVERPVLSHESMRNVRGWYQVPNKKGKMPSVKGNIAGTDIEISLKLTKDGKLDIQPEKASDKDIVDNHLKRMFSGDEFPPLLFQIYIDPPKKEMSRFLAKMALEAVALRFYVSGSIETMIDEPHFDLIRNYARFGTGVKDWPYHRRVVFPIDTKMHHPKTGEWKQAGFGHDLLITPRMETYFVFMLYGVEFVINVGGPSIKGYEEWLESNGNISPIVERTGAKLVAKLVGGSTEYFLEGDFKNTQGASFDQLLLKRHKH